MGRECSPVGTASDWHAADTGSTPLCGKGFFSESSFSADSLRCIRTAPSAITRIKIYAHVKDPVVHVRLRWIMETLKHPACTEGWLALLCRSWFSPGRTTRIFHGRYSYGTITILRSENPPLLSALNKMAKGTFPTYSECRNI